MGKNMVYVIWYYDMGSSSVKGVYNTLEGAKNATCHIVDKMNARIAKRSHEIDTKVELDDKCEEDGYVLLRYTNRIRVLEVKQYEINKLVDDDLDQFHYSCE